MAGNLDYAKLNLICGCPGTGKSTFTGKVIQKTHFKNAIVLIESIDQGGTPFAGLPVITGRDLLDTYSGGKVCVDADTIKLDLFLTALTEAYRNGLLVLDEAGMYRHKLFEKGEPIAPLLKLLKQRRKFNVEIYLIFHSVAEIPVQIFKYVNNVLLFHQTDMFAHKGGVIPNIDELNAAKKRIEKIYKSGNRFYAERIQLS